MKKIFILFLLGGISVLFISWGVEGHYWINHNASESFPASMSSYMVWTDSLANHGSDADDRKSWDPNESKRHYIDIDNYAEFNSTGHISSNYDSVVALHGSSFVTTNGILPWATKTMYDSLVLALQLHDWRHAMLHASDLGHYVGDGHQPLHITKNYDGSTSSQSGIHSRYETTMVGDYLSSLDVYPGDSVHVVTDVQKYIFDYLYIDYMYVDSIFAADDYAQGIAGNSTSAQYYQALFNKTGAFTLMLWHNASHSLAELMYTAWVQAGSPILTGIKEDHENMIIASVSPNPVTDNSVLTFTLRNASDVKFSIFDATGKLVYADEKYFPSGKNKINIESSVLNKEIYFIKLIDGKETEGIRFLKL
ncbi:MAG: T9SS type A sorting domain-containing protein [Bacteroidales bacterium]|jgi:hypothetical protein